MGYISIVAVAYECRSDFERNMLLFNYFDCFLDLDCVYGWVGERERKDNTFGNEKDKKSGNT